MASYTVKKGDTFWKIAQELLGDGNKWKDLIVNGDKTAGTFDPKSIQPGWVITTSGSSGDGTGGGAEGATTQALPKGAKLVKVGSSFRVIWSLGSNLGWAWYDIKGDQLKDIYGSTNPQAHIHLGNSGQFEAEYGNNYWGNVGEINLKADDPWQDLQDRIYNQFGYVPGFDTPEIKRLLTQAYFEDWDQNQWVVEYRNTEYYQSTTDSQRRWVGLSEAERDQVVADTLVSLKENYQSIYGFEFSPDDATMADQAFKVASGQMTLDQWLWETREAAADIEGTVEWNRRRQQEEDLREEGNQIENLALYAEQQWQSWVGPVDVPDGFADKWGNDLASGKASEADLENYLKEISNGRWSFKPPNLTWQDWSSTYKQQIKSTLELGSLADGDPLLSKILSSDLNGVDLNQMIRSDNRFLSTQQMYGELSGAVEDMGRRFGFI